MWRTCLLIIVMAVGMTACSGEEESDVEPQTTTAVETLPTDSGDEGGVEPLPTAELETLQTNFDAVSAAFMNANRTKDLETFRQLLTDDAELHDGEDPKIGIEEFMEAVSSPWSKFPGMDGRISGTFLGRDEVLNRQEVYGFLGWSEESPLIEWDLLEVRDGLIARWSFFYNPETRVFFIPSPEQEAADQTAAAWLTRYTSAWSSGDPAVVADLYAPGTVREDTLFQKQAAGPTEVEAYATDWFDWYPDVTVEMLEPIIERTSREPLTGGVFAIRLPQEQESCEVRIVVLLDTSDEGIVRERVYYDTDSLAACGWVS